MKQSNLPSKLSKTIYFTLWAVFGSDFATVTEVCYSDSVLSFLFIFAEYLKNHSKSQKNHKIENLILLDST
jgi:hypothetical protein